ncbi:MAG TPA: hypothetical protein VKZ93_07005 [Arenibacter sp.]|nr:hypothetical protein [Arenibacter sp.]
MPTERWEDSLKPIKAQKGPMEDSIPWKNIRAKLGAPIITVLLLIILLGIILYGVYVNS